MRTGNVLLKVCVLWGIDSNCKAFPNITTLVDYKINSQAFVTPPKWWIFCWISIKDGEGIDSDNNYV